MVKINNYPTRLLINNFAFFTFVINAINIKYGNNYLK